jgi:hypothetical protein
MDGNSGTISMNVLLAGWRCGAVISDFSGVMVEMRPRQ